MATWSTFREAGSSLLARRRAQRGFPTLGDDADRALVAALATLPSDARELARETGRQLGADVYSRRFHEDTLAKGIEVLSGSLAASGIGALTLQSSFHRSARIAFVPAPAVSGAPAPVRDGFAEGLLEGYLSHALNCEAHARAGAEGTIDLDLGAGRDVNQWRRSRA